jgi:hypothetical protein
MLRLTATRSGDADGLGEIRKKELVKSGLQLGIRSADDILLIEDKFVPCPLTHEQGLNKAQKFPRFHDRNVAPAPHLKPSHCGLCP